MSCLQRITCCTNINMEKTLNVVGVEQNDDRNQLTVVGVVRLPFIGHVQICLVPLARTLFWLHALICERERKRKQKDNIKQIE